MDIKTQAEFATELAHRLIRPKHRRNGGVMG
jgi:hypothetical protein